MDHMPLNMLLRTLSKMQHKNLNIILTQYHRSSWLCYDYD